MNIGQWFEIKTSHDIRALEKAFGGFHDACLREIHLWTEHSVDDKLSMSVSGDLDNHARVFFQRQFANPSAIEIEFHELCRLNIWPTRDNYDSVIESANISFSSGGDIQFLVDMTCESPIESLPAETRIIAKQVRWRPVEWTGPKLRYRNDDDA